MVENGDDRGLGLELLAYGLGGVGAEERCSDRRGGATMDHLAAASLQGHQRGEGGSGAGKRDDITERICVDGGGTSSKLPVKL